ncbi:MAG TPA: glutaredoxin family protein, partial [Polyangiaceae bacterium]|nr:glutaredoxin family protein [Polyangiaceae bacterium]
MLRRRLLRSCALLVLCSSSWGALACRSAARSGAAPTTEAVAGIEAALPGLRLTDDTPHLLLTWLNDEGDFRVEESIAAVPPEHRKQVRVVVTDQAAGAGSSVYVADLSGKREDGTYAVTSLPRAEWEKLGADRRKTRMEAFAPTAPGPTPPAAAEGAEPAARPPDLAVAEGAVTAIVYGADWCKPCHDAERYLKSLGVAVTKKNIEESRAAQAEMQQKL